MLKPLPQERSRRLRGFFEDAGYTEPSLRKYFGVAELPSRQLRNHSRLLDRTSASTQINVLLRWFWLWKEQTRETVTDLISEEFISLLPDRSNDSRLAT